MVSRMFRLYNWIVDVQQDVCGKVGERHRWMELKTVWLCVRW